MRLTLLRRNDKICSAMGLQYLLVWPSGQVSQNENVGSVFCGFHRTGSLYLLCDTNMSAESRLLDESVMNAEVAVLHK